jgi:hypothetical protein
VPEALPQALKMQFFDILRIDTKMVGILYLLLGFIPPLAAGPLAGLAFINILKRGKGWHQVPFWLALVLVNFLIVFWIATSTQTWLSISSFSAFFSTPLAAIASVLVIRIAWRRLTTRGQIDPARQRWLPIGLVLIPALQILSFVALLLFAPMLCKTGLMVCPTS